MLFDSLFENDALVDFRYPTVVVDVPIKFIDARSVSRQKLVPILLVRTEDGIVIPDEVSTWSRKEAETMDLKPQHERVAAVARLASFHILSGRPVLDTPWKVDAFIDSYLLLRLTSPDNIADRPFPLWEAVVPGTMRRELRAFDALVKSCELHYGELSGLSGALMARNGVFADRLPKGRNVLLSHLDDQWETYMGLQKLSPDLSPHLKKLARAHPVVRIGDGKTMTSEEGAAIIEATREPGYKGLFAAMMGLGRRTSENLHGYRCDYVPKEMARHFLDFDSPHSLLVFAHPRLSRYLGRLEDLLPRRTKTREAFLRTEYNGLQPRNVVENRKGYRAGWKGMVFYHRALLNIPPWIDEQCVNIFDECVLEMKETVKLASTDRKHPYLFVSCTRRGGNLGMPLCIPNVEKVFDAAARRVGLLGKPGIHLHGYRHHYVSSLRHDYGFSREQVMVAMGHRSIESQDEYATESRALHEAINHRQRARNAS